MIVTDDLITEITQEVENSTRDKIKYLDVAERFGKASNRYYVLLQLKILNKSLNTPLPISNNTKLSYYNKIKELLYKLNNKRWTVL